MSEPQEREYIVVYEDEDDGSDEIDTLVLDVGVAREEPGPVEVEADFGAVVTNEVSPLALTGLIMTFVGALVGIGTAVFFALKFPGSWPDGTTKLESDAPKVMAALVTVMTLLLVGGTLLVGFGRNLRARGILHSLSFHSQRR